MMAMNLDPATLRRVLFLILETEAVEMSCDECYEHLDRFAEIVADGEDAGEVMPLVQRHLERCASCREEVQALAAALRHMR
jgi:hypothetical protein